MMRAIKRKEGSRGEMRFGYGKRRGWSLKS